MSELALLERFVVENDDLLRLEELIGRFNIFDALDVARREINHSNFLAWLLDPTESHGQGDLFLKAVVMDLLGQAPAEARPLSPAYLDGADLHPADVRREWRHIDLLIAHRQPGLNFVIAIENKVDSGEHSNQLERYRQIVQTEFADCKHLLVFLTPDGDEASDDSWVPYSYADLHAVLARVRRTAGGALGADVQAFLDHYLTLIKRQLMTDSEIDDLCKKIYKNHRAAIDLIIQRATIQGNPVIAELTELVRSRASTWVITKARANEVRFTPQAWANVLPPIRQTRSKDQSLKQGWVACYFWCKEGYLEFSVWVIKTTDPDLQQRVLQRLTRDPAEFGMSLPKRRTRWTDGWTPVLERKVAEWDPDSEPDVADLRERAMRELDELSTKIAPIAAALRQVCGETPK